MRFTHFWEHYQYTDGYKNSTVLPMFYQVEIKKRRNLLCYNV